MPRLLLSKGGSLVNGQVWATLCSVINARFDLCSDLDSYGMNGNEQALFGDADALKVNKKGLKGEGIALNVDGEVVMANGEAVKGDENVMKGGREESKRDAATLNCCD